MKPTSPDAIAVVTGAGGGIGSSFARELYRRGFRLWLVDRCGEKLESLLRNLACDSNRDTARVETHVADLTDRDCVESLAGRLADNADAELLVNNAGFGSLEDFANVDVRQHADMIAIHVETPMRLVHAVLPQMRAQNRGGIINVASLGAFAPCAQAVQYASTKAYLVVFSEALREELRETNIRVQALCPGFVRTEFHSSQAMKNFHQRQIPSSLWSTPEDVVLSSLGCLSGRQVVVIPGWQSRMLGLFMRMVMLKPIVRTVTRPKSPTRTRTVDSPLVVNTPAS